MEAKLLNSEGKDTGKQKLPASLFSVQVADDTIYKVLVAARSNKREIIANTKGRSDVRGGGKKPWKQKGTGRARHGSIRSPIWIGGGVTFGPSKERNYKRKVNRKERQKALLAILTAKAKEDKLLVVDDLNIKDVKTREMAKVISKLPVKNKSLLIVLPKKDDKVYRASKNIQKVKVTNTDILDIIDLVSYEYLLVLPETINTLEKKFAK
ncbi:MAG: 50S ribosomal protein L4 [bacterium]